MPIVLKSISPKIAEAVVHGGIAPLLVNLISEIHAQKGTLADFHTLMGQFSAIIYSLGAMYPEIIKQLEQEVEETTKVPIGTLHIAYFVLIKVPDGVLVGSLKKGLLRDRLCSKGAFTQEEFNKALRYLIRKKFVCVVEGDFLSMTADGREQLDKRATQ